MPGLRQLVRGCTACVIAIAWSVVLVVGVQPVAAAEDHAEEAAVIFSGVAERQIVAPVPQPVWMGAVIMGFVILAGMRRARRGREAR
jgi:hypothetical protein